MYPWNRSCCDQLEDLLAFPSSIALYESKRHLPRPAIFPYRAKLNGPCQISPHYSPQKVTHEPLVAGYVQERAKMDISLNMNNPLIILIIFYESHLKS